MVPADGEVQPEDEEVQDRADRHDPEMERRRERGKAALKAEAKSKRHMLIHVPKNPYCDVCTKAKMYKPPGYSKGVHPWSMQRSSGDHITGDYLIAKSDPEAGIDDGRVATTRFFLTCLTSITFNLHIPYLCLTYFRLLITT